MSVITSKSSMLSILKTPNTTARSSMHRVRFQLPKNIRQIISDFKSGTNLRDYENLVCTIRDSEINDNDLLSLLAEAKNCTSLLNYDLRLFVQALILIKWSNRNRNVVEYYQDFISDLISAHSCHIKLVVDQLIKLFLIVEETDYVDDLPSENAIIESNNIHVILKTTLTTVPLSEDILVDCLRQNFPYINVPSHKHASYLYNMLKIIEYQPDLKINILQIAIDRLILLDVQCPRDEIFEYEENSNNLFEMEVDEEESKIVMKYPIANTLDIMLNIMFKFIKNECSPDGKINKNKCAELYNDFLITFENVILLTHECHHVQFIMFYICSFDCNLANDFLKFLWRSATSPSISPVIRQTSVAYISSFLARAEFLSLGYLKNYLAKFSEWIHSYIVHNDFTSEYQIEFKQHTVFYSVCQGLFYLISFRHQDLVNASVKLVFLQSLNLPKIISCKLNPLKYCLPSVVDTFAAVTRAYQLAYCYTIIENNARGTLPIVGKGGQIIINPILNVYFPFDPYVLIRSNIFISPLYREYKSMLNQEVNPMKTNKTKQRLISGTEDEDDFIGDESLDHISSDGNDIPL